MATREDQGSVGSNESDLAVEEMPALFDGQRLDQSSFHAIYEHLPEDFKAELIDGVVYLMNMPLHPDHAGPDSLMIGCLVVYSIETPGTKVLNNATTKLAPRSEVQPDSSLQIKPESGGRTRYDAKGYLIVAPELIVEIGSSTLKRDVDAKKRVYEEAGVLEYVVFDATLRKFHWSILRDGRFEPLLVDPDGLYRSQVFPGFWIDEAAFARDDGMVVMAALRRGLENPEHAAFVEQLRRNRANRS